MHLLKAAGAFFILAAVLKLAQALYELLRQTDLALSLLKEGITRSSSFQLPGGENIGLVSLSKFTLEDALGLLLGPIAAFLFWAGIVFIAIMVYQSGKVIFPLEEYEQRIAEHHRRLIQKAVEYHKKKK